MSKIIENGDICRFFWDGTSQADVVILHMPQGEGDLLQIEYTKDGTVQAFSPLRTDYTLEKRNE